MEKVRSVEEESMLPVPRRAEERPCHLAERGTFCRKTSALSATRGQEERRERNYPPPTYPPSMYVGDLPGAYMREAKNTGRTSKLDWKTITSRNIMSSTMEEKERPNST